MGWKFPAGLAEGTTSRRQGFLLWGGSLKEARDKTPGRRTETAYEVAQNG